MAPVRPIAAVLPGLHTAGEQVLPQRLGSVRAGLGKLQGVSSKLRIGATACEVALIGSL